MAGTRKNDQVKKPQTFEEMISGELKGTEFRFQSFRKSDGQPVIYVTTPDEKFKRRQFVVKGNFVKPHAPKRAKRKPVFLQKITKFYNM